MNETRKQYLKYIKPLIFTIFIISAIAIIMQPQVRQNITPSRIEALVNHYGTLSVMIFLIIYTLRPVFLILPVSIMAIAGGSAFGAVMGTVYSLIGNFLSATLAFYASRYLFRDFAENILRDKKKFIDGNLQKNGIKIIALARIIMPYDILSYVAGISKISYKHFIAGTMLTSTVEMTLYNFIGENIKLIIAGRVNDKKVIIGSICVLIFGIVLIIYKKRKLSNE